MVDRTVGGWKGTLGGGVGPGTERKQAQLLAFVFGACDAGRVSIVAELVAELSAETEVVDGMVSGLDESGWNTPTPAAGWAIREQIAHLSWTDAQATAAATDPTVFDQVLVQAWQDPTGFVDVAARDEARKPSSQLLADWRHRRRALADALIEVPSGKKLPWFGPPMSPASMATARFMETWAHGLDVREALGLTYEPSDRIKHVCHLGTRTRDFSYGVHGLTPPSSPFRIELTAPSGEVWEWGPEDATQSVRGPAYDFARLVTQRIHRDDTALEATGDDAEKWLSIAQAFAGPAGSGRAPEGDAR